MATLQSLLALVILFVTSGCVGSPGALAPCDSRSMEGVICNLTNPEDMAFLPDRAWIIVSEMAQRDVASDEEDAPPVHGRLTALHLEELELSPLYPGGLAPGIVERPGDEDAMPGWGSASCPGAPDPAVFKPHGIDVGKGPDERPALAVVNHGSREAVEFFEIISGPTPLLVWRGCVPMPDDIMTNDVALLPGGGFVVTNFMPKVEGVGLKAIWTAMKISLGASTGSVLRWEPGGQLAEIENSKGSAPNGVVASADGSEIFVAEWGGGRVYRLRFDGMNSPERDEVEVDSSPDNLTWTRDGRLLVAGQHGGIMKALGCSSIREGGCDLGYSVYILGPSDLEVKKLIEGRGAVSVALEVGDELFVGAFVGDQIMRIPSPD